MAASLGYPWTARDQARFRCLADPDFRAALTMINAAGLPARWAAEQIDLLAYPPTSRCVDIAELTAALEEPT